VIKTLINNPHPVINLKLSLSPQQEVLRDRATLRQEEHNSKIMPPVKAKKIYQMILLLKVCLKEVQQVVSLLLLKQLMQKRKV